MTPNFGPQIKIFLRFALSSAKYLKFPIPLPFLKSAFEPVLSV